MNETSATSASGLSLLPDGIATLTAIHFTIITVVAILVVIGLIWGIRAKRSRVKASQDVVANAQEAGVPPVPIKAEPRSAPAPAPVPIEDRASTGSQAQVQTRAPVTPSTIPTPPSSADMKPVSESATDAVAEPPQPSEPISESPAAAPLAPDPMIEPTVPSEALALEPVVAATAGPAHYADDPVTQLKGLGPKVATRLAELGVTTIGEMAALSDGQAQSIDAQLGAFTGRMGRDRWIEQARLLAAGDKAGFEAVFGKL